MSYAIFLSEEFHIVVISSDYLFNIHPHEVVHVWPFEGKGKFKLDETLARTER